MRSPQTSSLSPRRFAGQRVRALRHAHGLNQAGMAARLGISVSYLSQIEGDDRPLTPAVLAGLAQAFPTGWGSVAPDDDAALLAAALAAAQDPALGLPPLADAALRQAVTRQPQLAERLVAAHRALTRTLDQLRSLDDALDRGGQEVPLPWEEVRDWFHAQGNYLDRLDRRAEAIAAELAAAGEDPRGRLARRHGVAVLSAAGDRIDPVLRDYQADSRRLLIDPALPVASQAFLQALQLARLELADEMAAVVAGARLRSPPAEQLLAAGLANYAAGAVLMPYARFRVAARDLRHDVAALAARFAVSFEQACHRLSTLQRPGAAGTPMFFCRVDMAGNITKRHSATRLQFARYGGACPLWIVHEAVAIPDRILVQLAETPDGVRYVSIARGITKGPGRWPQGGRRYAVALGCEVRDAAGFVYADGLNLQGATHATPIGISCRICPRDACDQRAFPPAGRHLAVDPDRRGVVPYQFN